MHVIEGSGEEDKHTEEGDEGEHDPGDQPWEAQVGWIYAGHGEWEQANIDDKGSKEEVSPVQEPEWIQQWLVKNDKDIGLSEVVRKGGYPNRWGACIPIESGWNLDIMKELLSDYQDKEVVDWLRYGWPSGRLPTLQPPGWSMKNHKGASDFPEELQKYIDKEKNYGAVMGPFRKIPFKGNIGISPLSTRPKKGSADRRVILDLSFPIGQAVNDGIPKDTYMGFAAKLTFPKMDDFGLRIYKLGKACCMFKIDLSRYFRQIPLDPADYPLIGYIIEGHIYFDKVLPMGMRSAPYIAQRITNAIAYIHRRLGYFLLNYVDDLWEPSSDKKYGRHMKH